MPTQMSAPITSLPRVLTRAAALFRGSRAAPHTRRLHIYKCTYDEQKAAFEQGLAPPDEPFAVSAAAAAAAVSMITSRDAATATAAARDIAAAARAGAPLVSTAALIKGYC